MDETLAWLVFSLAPRSFSIFEDVLALDFELVLHCGGLIERFVCVLRGSGRYHVYDGEGPIGNVVSQWQTSKRAVLYTSYNSFHQTLACRDRALLAKKEYFATTSPVKLEKAASVLTSLPEVSYFTLPSES